jgi:hypothetical protein
MRTLWIIIGGVALTRATQIFLLLWVLLAGLNLWVGVARAGYTLREELPIFLLIFALPAALALLLRWKVR